MKWKMGTDQMNSSIYPFELYLFITDHLPIQYDLDPEMTHAMELGK